MNRIDLGPVTITRVLEWAGPVSTVDEFFPDVPRTTWTDNQDWLAPHFWRPHDNAHPVALQSWLVHSQGRNILIDTGAGNDKTRPTNPTFDHLNTNYLEQLATVGLQPDDIDVVVNTHLHIDHVGWNTVKHSDAWTPTFRNATYFLPERDLAYYDGPNINPAARLHIDDSVLPVLQAGQATTFTDTHRIDKHLTLKSAPGHTPGTSVVKLEAGTSKAVFVGDVIHNPVQIGNPQSNSCFCVDPTAARTSRHQLLNWAADNHALILPAHFGGAGAAEVAHHGNTFNIKRWAPFTAPPPV